MEIMLITLKWKVVEMTPVVEKDRVEELREVKDEVRMPWDCWDDEGGNDYDGDGVTLMAIMIVTKIILIVTLKDGWRGAKSSEGCGKAGKEVVELGW